MADKLLVRMYNVNLGDFIYLRVPDTNHAVHIMIDCGTLSGMEVLTNRLENLKGDLPQDEDGKWQLDLLVVTHPHLDHHKGFTPEHFEKFSIKNLWLSPAYDRSNPQAVGFFALKDATLLALKSLYGFAQGHLKTEVGGLLEMNKSEIIEHLCGGMGQGIIPKYVNADTSAHELDIFESNDIRLKVLSPMSNIDGYYMGGTGLDISHGGLDLGFNFDSESMPLEESDKFSGFLAEGYHQLFTGEDEGEPAAPQNISSLDFTKLKMRLRSNALALTEMTGKIENNLSVVLLLEWYGKRLLFTGDAEWSSAYDGAVKAGRCNGAWNVMWRERNDDLTLPLDFLKVGHHGSENATPWTDKKKNKIEHPINKILDAMLPLDQKENAVAVVSTERTNRYPSIPDGKLLKELAKRVKNVRSDYLETSTSEKIVAANTPQPQRTDLELSATGEPGPYIEEYFIH